MALKITKICNASFRILIATIWSLPFGLCSGYAQQSFYTDMWSEQNEVDGTVTIWGAGVTDDTGMHGYEHNVRAETHLTGPTGNSDSNLWQNGFVRAVVSVQAGEGDFQTTSTHRYPYPCNDVVDNSQVILTSRLEIMKVYLWDQTADRCFTQRCNANPDMECWRGDYPKKRVTGNYCPSFASIEMLITKINFVVEACWAITVTPIADCN